LTRESLKVIKAPHIRYILFKLGAAGEGQTMGFDNHPASGAAAHGSAGMRDINPVFKGDFKHGLFFREITRLF